jgi:ABC-type multidrug transport system ATPase subunit
VTDGPDPVPHPVVHPAPVLDVRGVGKLFAGASEGETVRALDAVSFSVDAGDTVGLLGRNGAGKTTLIAVLGGLLEADEGQVLVRGIDARADVGARRRVTAVIGARPPLDLERTVREHLVGAAAAHGLAGRRGRAEIDRVIAALRLEPVAGRRLATVERGARRRVVLAAATLVGSDALLVDEPTRGLDPESRHEVLDCLRAITRDDDQTLIVATHDVTVVRGLCRRLIVLDEGRILAVGATRNLLAPLADPAYRIVVSRVSASLAPRLAVAFVGSTLEHVRHQGTVTAALDHPDDLYDLIHVLESEGAVIEAIERVDMTIDDVLRQRLTPQATYDMMRGWPRR